MPRSMWLVCLGLWSCAAPQLAAEQWLDTPADYPRHLEHPVFTGRDSDSAARLNRWVNDLWANEHGCPHPAEGITSAGASYERRLVAVSFNATVALFVDSAEYSCPGTAHPDAYREEYLVDVKSGGTIDLWKSLPEDAKTQVRTRLSALGLAAHQNDPCAQAYPLTGFPERFIIHFDGAGVTMEPAFPSALRACAESLPVSTAQLREWFATLPEIVRLLDGLTLWP